MLLCFQTCLGLLGVCCLTKLSSYLPAPRGQVEAWFGTIPQSMQSLFVIMTLSEWDEMAHVLSRSLGGLLSLSLWALA